MATKLTKKQKDFADEYLKTGNGTQSALKAYDTKSPGMAAVLASRAIRIDNVRQYLEDNASIAANEVMRIVQNGESDSVRLAASKDVLDRAGYKPVEKRQTINATFDLNDTQEMRDALALLEQQKHGRISTESQES